MKGINSNDTLSFKDYSSETASIEELTTHEAVRQYADVLRKEYRFLTMTDTHELYRYDEAEGIFVNDGEIIIKIQLEGIAPDISNHKVNEVIGKIKRNTYRERKEIDSETNWLHLNNGWLNLETEEFEHHSSERLSLSKLPIQYDPKATCPTIIKFLKATLDPESIVKVVKMLSYCLIPNCKYQKAFMLVGNGANGKSTLINLIEAFIGKHNVSNVSLQGLSERFAKADLYGKWVNTFSDIPNKKIAETDTFKILADGGSMRAEKKNKDAFNFNNRAKLIFSANEIPPTDDDSNAFIRRWVIIPFRHTFEGDEADPDLLQKLTTPQELSGLLNLLLQNLKTLEMQGGFQEDSIEKIRAIYETNASRVRDFIHERCILGNGYFIESIKLQEAYRQYGKEKGDRVLDDNVLGKELKRLSIENKPKTLPQGRKRCYVGIQLKQETLVSCTG